VPILFQLSILFPEDRPPQAGKDTKP